MLPGVQRAQTVIAVTDPAHIAWRQSVVPSDWRQADAGGLCRRLV